MTELNLNSAKICLDSSQDIYKFKKTYIYMIQSEFQIMTVLNLDKLLLYLSSSQKLSTFPNLRCNYETKYSY